MTPITVDVSGGGANAVLIVGVCGAAAAVLLILGVGTLWCRRGPLRRSTGIHAVNRRGRGGMADAERTQSVGLSEMKGFRVTNILRRTFENEGKFLWLPRYSANV